MKSLQIAFVAVIAMCISSAASAEVKLTIQNGRVSLSAKDATVRQILTEWARIGQTKIVNVEKIAGTPQTIELTDVSEAEALEILLRNISGYIAAPRAVATGNVSQFDSIVVMPTTAAPRPPVAAAAATPASPPMFQPVQVPPVDDDVDDERPAAPVPVPAGAAGAQRGPIFNQFPPPQVINPQTGQPMPQPGVAQPFNSGQPMQPQQPQPAQQPSNVPTAPFGGVAVPGMVVPAPQQPGQQPPGQIVPPGQRRPGGPEGSF